MSKTPAEIVREGMMRRELYEMGKKPSNGRQYDELAAKEIDISHSTFTKGRKVLEIAQGDRHAPEHVRQVAKNQWEKLKAGTESFHGAYQSVQQAERESAEDIGGGGKKDDLRSPDQFGLRRLYLIEHPLGFYKIGIARHTGSRLKDLQTGSPFELQIREVCTTNNPETDEKRLHELLSEYHVRGEWFELPDRVVDWFPPRLLESEDFEELEVVLDE